MGHPLRILSFMKTICFLCQRHPSRYAPIRVGKFVRDPKMEVHSDRLKGVHVYEGRPLSVEEFNRVSETLYKTDSRIPTWPLIVQVPEDADLIFQEATPPEPTKEEPLMEQFKRLAKPNKHHGEQSFQLSGSRAP